MATPSALCQIKDGAAAAVDVAQTNNATPGNTLTVSLKTTTSVTTWTLRVLSSDFASLVGQSFTQTSGFSVAISLPAGEGNIKFSSIVGDGSNSYTTPDFTVSVGSSVTRSVAVHYARGVCTSNMSLTAFVGVSGGTPQDGVTYAQGEYVLLAGQTSKAENGLYVVGAVASGTAPLTRAPDWSTGTVLPAAATVELSAGTLFALTTWKVTTAGAVTVGTTAIDLYPREVTQAVTLSAGTATVSNVPVLSTSKTQVSLVRTATGGTVTSTVQYCPTVAGANGLTAGTVGTGQVVIQACVAAGTIANTDTSTLACTITNW